MSTHTGLVASKRAHFPTPKTFSVIIYLVALFLFSCSDSINPNSVLKNERAGTLTIRIPASTGFSSRGENDQEGEETDLNTLNVYFFTDNGVLYRNLALDDATTDNTGNYLEYKLTDIEAGDYHIIATANLDGYLDDESRSKISSDDLTKEDLEALVLHFESEKQIKRGNLPKACLKPGSEDLNRDGSITFGEGETKSIILPLEFLCSKIRYTLLFNSDEDGFSKGFGNNSFELTSTIVSNLKATTLLTVNNEINPEIIGTEELPDNWKIQMAKFALPENENYPKDNQGKFLGDLTEVWQNNNKKIAWQGTIYIPESLKEPYTTVNVTGKAGETETEHRIELKNNGNGIGRGEMFDIVTRITKYPSSEYQTSINVIDWNEIILPAELTHTYLTLEKTEGIQVTSGKETRIGYTSNGLTPITIECEQKIDGKQIIIGEAGKDSSGSNVLILKLNDEISVDEYDSENIEGKEIECYVVAGNIRKLIKVSYEVKPYISLSNNFIEIRGSEENGKYVVITTNLGGVKIYKTDKDCTKKEEINLTGNNDFSSTLRYLDNSGEEQSESSTISIGNVDLNVHEIRLPISSTEIPTTKPVYHYFYIEGENGFNGNTFGEQLTVVTYPRNPDYRIYFRAINDYQDENSDGSLSPFLSKDIYTFFPGEENNPWADWWSTEKENPSIDSHYLKMFGSAGNPYSKKMIGDRYNPGWYFYDIDESAFSSYNYLRFSATEGDGDELHSCPHADYAEEMSLYEFDSQESWYLYDPTTEPYWMVYNEKPEIVDVTYTVYTTDRVISWNKTYGESENKPTGYEMHYEFVDTESGNKPDLGKCVKLGDNNYVSQFKLKSPKANHSKAITLNIFEKETIYENHYLYLRIEKNTNFIPTVGFISDASEMHDETGEFQRNMELYLEEEIYLTYRILIPQQATSYIIQYKSKTFAKETNVTEKNVICNSWELNKYGGSNYPTEEYGLQPGLNTVETIRDVMLFGGSEFINDTGYYFNGKWSESKPEEFGN